MFAAACIAVATLPDAANAQIKLDPERIAEIAKLLPEKPTGVGRTIEDRAARQAVGQSSKFADAVKNAEHFLARPIPVLTDDLFFDWSRIGEAPRYAKVISERRERRAALVLAECIENRGRFPPAIEASIRATCAEKTWVSPAHDRSLKNFRGEVNQIDLISSALSWNLATADYWLGDKLGGR